MRKLDIFGMIDNYKSNIEEELNRLVSLNHLNLIKYYDVFENEEFFCIITEHLDVIFYFTFFEFF